MEFSSKMSLEKKLGPICVFFEGAKTNGLGILQIEDSLMNDIGCLIINDANTSTVLLGIKYIDKSHCSPINTTRNPFLHFLLLLANPMNEVRITAKTLGITETPESSMIFASTDGSSRGGGNVVDIKPVKDAIYSFYESIGIKKVSACALTTR